MGFNQATLERNQKGPLWKNVSNSLKTRRGYKHLAERRNFINNHINFESSFVQSPVAHGLVDLTYSPRGEYLFEVKQFQFLRKPQNQAL